MAKEKESYKYLPVLIPSQPGIHATPDERIHFKKAILWVFLSCLLRCCYSFLRIKRTLSDYLYIERLFIDFWGSLKETCVQRSPCIKRSPGQFPRVTVIYRFDCNIKFDITICQLCY